MEAHAEGMRRENSALDPINFFKPRKLQVASLHSCVLLKTLARDVQESVVQRMHEHGHHHHQRIHAYIDYITLHHMTLYSIALHYITLHYTTYIHTYMHTYIHTYIHTLHIMRLTGLMREI